MSADAAGVEGGILVVRVQGADRATEDLRIPAARDRPRHYPHAARHHLQEYSRRNGPGTGMLSHLAVPYYFVSLYLWLAFNRGGLNLRSLEPRALRAMKMALDTFCAVGRRFGNFRHRLSSVVEDLRRFSFFRPGIVMNVTHSFYPPPFPSYGHSGLGAPEDCVRRPRTRSNSGHVPRSR